MKKLIPMVDFVLEQETKWNYETTGLEISIRKYKDVVFKINNYANFLKRILEIWMFVPCDSEGNVLEFPNRTDDYWRDANGMTDEFYEEINKFNKAKEKVLFDGFEIQINDGLYTLIYKNEIFKLFLNFSDAFKNKTIEDLIPYNPPLTESAIKQLGL